MNFVTRIIAMTMLVACGQALAQGAAQNFPNRTIRIIVPFPAGGPTDVLARVIGQRMSEEWVQAVVIENRPGGNTAIGAQLVAKASPDGYTLLAAMDTTMVMNPVTTGNLPYDPFRDFASITLAANNTSLLTVRAADGPMSVQELIAKANPTFSTGGGKRGKRLSDQWGRGKGLHYKWAASLCELAGRGYSRGWLGRQGKVELLHENSRSGVGSVYRLNIRVRPSVVGK